ncbi:MAG TPA: hypothetical protein VKM72_01620 [Thermoanaerobaculia bacterium]|nr:hypothetical protein [Thermoanaerobaculia bacterium]
MATDTLSKKIGTWDALNTNVKARLPEVPQLNPTVKELDEVIVEGRELQGLQDVHRRQLRETTQRTQELERRGRKLRNQLIVGLQSVFGVDNMVLVEFGLEPRLPRKRTRLTAEEKVAKLEAELEVAKSALDKKRS